MRRRAGLLAAALLASAATPVLAGPPDYIGDGETKAGPVSVGQAPAASNGVAVLTWAALAASVAALSASGAALTLAVGARRRAATVADELRRTPSPAVDPRLAGRVAQLEARVRALSSPSPATEAATPGVEPAPQPAAPARDPFPPASPSRAPTAGAGSLAAWLAELRDDFARLALDPSSAAAGFIAARAPMGAAVGADGVTLLDGFEGAKLWAVRIPGDEEVWALTPGEQAVLNWSAHFASQRTQVAAEVFGEAFDLADGGSGLRLEEPALVRRGGSGRLSVRRRGRLSGFRS